MATDIVKLVVQADTSGVRRANDDLGKLPGQSKKAQKATDNLARSFKRLVFGVIGVHTAMNLMRDSLNKVVAFEKFDKQLAFVTGSAAAAAKEMGFLRSVAQENALVLQGIVAPYTRVAESMRQLGLESEVTRELFIGVANAAATFGMSTDEVNGILVAFSQVASKGTVQAEELRNQIGERIPGAFSLAARAMGKTTVELNKMLELGQLSSADFIPKFAEALQQNYGTGLADVTDTLGAAMRRASTATTDFVIALNGVSSSGDTLKSLLETVTGVAQAATLSVTLISNKLEELRLREQFEEVANSIFGVGMAIDRLGASADRTKALDGAVARYKDLINSMEGTDLQSAKTQLDVLLAKELGALRDAKAKVADLEDRGLINKSPMSAGALEEVELRTKSYQLLAHMVEGAQARIDALNAIPPEKKTFSIEELSQEAAGPSAALAKLDVQMRTEEQKIEDSFTARMAIVNDYHSAIGKLAVKYAEQQGISYAEAQEDLLAESGVKLIELEDKIWSERNEKLAEIQDNSNASALQRLEEYQNAEWEVRDAAFIEEELRLTEKHEKELEVLDKAYKDKLLLKKDYDEKVKISEGMLTKSIEEMKKREFASSKQQQLQNYSTTLSMTGDIMGQLQNMAKEGSKSAKALFIANKAVSIAQAIINTELGATAALGLGPFGIPMATTIRALGYASVGLMAGSAIAEAGSYADGGIVPGGSYSGDRLTANVNSGEMILNATQQRNLFDVANGSGGNSGAKTNIIVNNNAGVEVQVSESKNGDEQNFEIMLSRVEKNIAAKVSSGGSVISRNLEKTYGLKRGNA